jgi:hypothetical protein
LRIGFAWKGIDAGLLNNGRKLRCFSNSLKDAGCIQLRKVEIARAHSQLKIFYGL